MEDRNQQNRYLQFFSEDTASFMRSPVREIFKKVDLNQIYSFAGGYPSAETFPMADMAGLSAEVVRKYGAQAFQYGATQGAEPLRKALSDRYDVPLERIQITTSSQQGIDVCARVMVDPGEVVLTLNPTYLGALQSFHSYRADIRGVEHSSQLEAFRHNVEEVVAECRREGKTIKFFYIIPDFQNPTGETMTVEERKMLLSLAEELDFLIVEDSPYKELRYEGETLPSLYSLAPDLVIHLGSFSKIFAPGFRLGWIFAHPTLLDNIYVCKQSLDLCPPVFDQYVTAEFLSSGLLDKNLVKSIALYRRKRDLLLESLEKYMPGGITWTHPEGGLFLFLTLPVLFDAVAFYEKALSVGVAYVAGNFFFTDGRGRNTMRMNFSFLPEEKMVAGVQLLARLLEEELR